jgi:hypothetical protein
VGLLAIIDHPGPDVRITRFDKLRWYVYSLAQLDRRQRWPYIVDRLRFKIRKRPRLYRALTRLGRLLGIKVDPRMTEYRVKTMSATMTALELYSPGPYPGRLTLFRARGGNVAINKDRLGGWGRTALGGVEVHEFPCTHMDMFEEPHCRALGGALHDCLDRAERPADEAKPSDGPVATAAAVSL